MKINMKAPVSTIVAVLSGAVLLLAIIFNLSGIRSFMLNWAMVVAAAALLLGVANLGLVHWDKVRKGENRLYSIALLASLALTFSVTMWYGPSHQLPQWIFENVQLPVEASLAAVMTVSLVLALIRLLKRRPDLNSILFVIFAVLTLISSVPLFGLYIPLLSEGLRDFNHLLASAGARGILIGVAIGSVATGLRILMGADRPYGG